MNCIRCGGDHVWDRFTSECAINGRTLADCDYSDCHAVDEPQTPEEYKDAYEHWRNHQYLSGCSHGC